MLLCLLSNTFFSCHVHGWTLLNAMSAKERYTTTVDSKLLEELRVLAIRKKRTANILLEEAIQDLLKKYGVIGENDQSQSAEKS
jgi:hypothetical protein